MRVYPSLRRALVPAVCAVALTAAYAAPASAAGFKFGVAAADVKSTSALLWTRSNTTGKVRLEIARNAQFQNKRTITGLSATAANDNVVRKTVGKLRGGKDYFYRFRKGKTNKSVTGHFRTPPKGTADKTVRFAISGDADAER